MTKTPLSNPSSPPLTPSEQEARKTPLQRAEDVAYTINHTILCGMNDILTPFLSNWIQKHVHQKSGMPGTEFKGYVKEWFIGEALGDIGGVPIAIGFQRLAPEFMARVAHNVAEPLVGGFFRRGAAKAARLWADEHQLSHEAPEVAAMEEKLYRHEIDHLPQAAVWTVSSIGLNIATQKLLPVFSSGDLGNPGRISELLLSKSLSSGITASVLVGGRALAPHTARSWDDWTNRHLFYPGLRVAGNLFGMDEKTIDDLAAQHDKSWKDRILPSSPSARQL